MRDGRGGQSTAPAFSLNPSYPNRLPRSYQPPTPHKAKTKFLSFLSPHELGMRHHDPLRTPLPVHTPGISRGFLSPSHPCATALHFTQKRESRAGVTRPELVRVPPRSEGLSLCHPPKNEPAGVFVGFADHGAKASPAESKRFFF